VFAFFSKSENVQVSVLGDHWKRLGFASGDPVTEINNAGGVLHALCMLYLMQEFSEDATALANKAANLAELSLAASRLAVEIAQSGRLTADYNKQRQVIGVTCLLYSAIVRKALATGSVEGVRSEIRSAEGLARLLEVAPMAVSAKSA
jgi:hypothetical protein